jgi:N-methylhydantoinase B
MAQRDPHRRPSNPPKGAHRAPPASEARTLVSGSEKFDYRPRPAAELRAAAAGRVRLHDVHSDRVHELDPLTYEVVRHRLVAITEEMGDTLKRMSGSVVVTDCNDFDTAILDETGDEVAVGLYNTALCASMDMAVKWTIEHRADSPGISRGDVFLCNDPWVGGGLHQNDVSVYAPFFWDGELFAWTCAVAHQVDLGGVSPGSWSVAGSDVFWESIPIPPLKIVENDRRREDVIDSYLRRSRVPNLIGLDLRAKIGAMNVAHAALRRLLGKYGPTVVKAVMRRMLDNAESRLRARLAELPDGTWTSVAYQDQAKVGDRNLHRIVLRMTKAGTGLTFDFTGTDPQAEGVINCTYAGLRGGVIAPLLYTLAGDIPWAPGGFYRCLEFVAEPGTLNNCTFPAGVGKASVASSWATMNAVTECLSGLLDTHPELRRELLSVCCGTWDLTLLSGVDQRHNPFVTMLCDAMAGGIGARGDRDGIDTGGAPHIPMGAVADVEMNEFSFPILYLWRREEIDSGGAGRYRGGVGASSCFVVHDAPGREVHLVVSAAGKAVPQSTGLAGGYPANTQYDVLVRDSGVRRMFAERRIPADLGELGGRMEIVAPHLETDLGDGDVYYTQWQGGGGYGDPLLRDPESVCRDVADRKVSPDAARDLYGVVATAGGAVDGDRTERQRARLRHRRAGMEARS